MTKILTPSEQGKQERDEKIMKIAQATRGLFPTQDEWLRNIARKVKCHHVTARRVLKKNGMLWTRKQGLSI